MNELTQLKMNAGLLSESNITESDNSFIAPSGDLRVELLDSEYSGTLVVLTQRGTASPGSYKSAPLRIEMPISDWQAINDMIASK